MTSSTFKVCKHAIGGGLGDRGWTGKIGKHVLLDFIIQMFTHQQSLHFSENYENLKETLTGNWSDNVNNR